MPGGEHILVIQDLCTKYPVAVLLNNDTKAKTTINALDQIFTNFGRPLHYHSDNGPPFASHEFTSYMQDLGIESDPSFPYRPQSNPVETWMKPLGKCLKIADRSKVSNDKGPSHCIPYYPTSCNLAVSWRNVIPPWVQGSISQ